MAWNNSPKSYAAFVSYRHTVRDRQWAIRIANALESYRTPKSLRAKGYPASLGKLFRDDDEIQASTDLSDQIKEALALSSFLIVICSPDTPKSRWIRREIELFQDMGKSDRIIPLLVEGEPEEAFPPEILRRVAERQTADGTLERYSEEVEPVAADVRLRKGERPGRTLDRAVLRLAAPILGVSFDELYQREARRRQVQLQRVVAGVATALVAMITGGLWYWDANLRITTRYCANYAERYGIPKCVGEIDEKLARKQHQVFRMISKAGLPREMTSLTGSLVRYPGHETVYEDEEWSKDVAHFVYKYQADGTLANIAQYSETDQLLRRIVYEFSADKRTAVARFSRELGVAERQRADGSLLGSVRTDSNSQRAAIGQHRLRFDSEGRLLERLYEPVGGGAQAMDAQGVYGRTYRYNAQGLIESLRNLDAAGDTHLEKTGVAELRLVRNKIGRLVEARWLDKNGALVVNDDQYSRALYLRDGEGRNVAKEYFDINGKPTLSKRDGIVKTTWARDTRGQVIEQAYFGLDGKPILTKDFGIAKSNFTYDARNNLTEETYFGIDGEPILTKHAGVAKITRVHDARGNVIEAASFGTDGKPILSKNNGIAKTTSTFDARGNLTEQAYFGLDGKPILTKDFGIAKSTFTYDARNNLTEEAYFGIDGKLIPTKDTGVAKVTLIYDARNNLTEEAYFGIGGKPILTKDTGVAKITWVNDARGNVIEKAFFGTDGKPILTKDTGVAKATWLYDARGNEIESVSFGTDGNPILSRNHGVAKTTWVNDARGNVIEEASFGTDGKPALRTDTRYAREIIVYDERSNPVQNTYLGTDGKPILAKGCGVATIESSYNPLGDRVKMEFFGTDGQPAECVLRGVASISYDHDQRGNVVEKSFADRDGHPILNKELGVAKISSTYDARGNSIEEAYFGTDGEPILTRDLGIAKIASVYDARGNVIEEMYYGTDGRPIPLRESGIAKMIWAFDAHDRIVEQVNFGADGKPVLRRDFGIARITSTYDSRGNIILEEYWGIDGQAIEDSRDGVSRQSFAYDARDNLIKISYFDAAGEPTTSRLSGVSALTTAYDELGHPIERLGFYDSGEVAYIDFPYLAEKVTEAAKYQEHAIAMELAHDLAKKTERAETEKVGAPGISTAASFGNLSWHALYAGRPDVALEAVSRALDISPDLLWIEMNRAHALMFLDRAEEARFTYLSNKGKVLPGIGSWEEIVLGDFRQLENDGLKHSQMDDIKVLLEPDAND